MKTSHEAFAFEEVSFRLSFEKGGEEIAL